jgi:hypothetical protein
VFWVLQATGWGLWLTDQLLWIVFDLVLQKEMPVMFSADALLQISEIPSVTWNAPPGDENFDFATACSASSRTQTQLGIARLELNYFRPHNRLAFAFTYEWWANRKGTDCAGRASGFGVKFSGGLLLSATYGHVEA